MKNDDAASYTLVMVIALVIIAALVFAYLTPSLNKITTIGMNPAIEHGQISEQTAFTYNWNLTFFQYSIGIGLIGFAIFCIVRAIEIAEAGAR